MKINKNKLLSYALVLFSVVSVATGCNKNKNNDDIDDPLKDDPYKNEEVLIDLSVRDVECANGCVAAANPYAAHAGLEVLMRGGNAFDAAVATSFALGVVEPHCSGIAGGGILVGYNKANDEYISYNFREIVPGAGTASAYKSATEMDEGIRSAGVPTYVQSLLGILDNHGNFKNTKEGRQTVIGPASKLASEGFKVTKELATAISGQVADLSWTEFDPQLDYCGAQEYQPQAFQIYTDDGIPKGEGDTIKNPNLANVYNEVIEKGSDGFYKGWVAERLLEAQEEYCCNSDVTGCHTMNTGLWDESDFEYILENYPKRVNPVEGDFEGYHIVSSTTPSSGGLILLEALHMLEAYEDKYGKITDLGHNSAEYINLLSTVTQLAYGDKQKYIGDASINPADGKPFVDVPVEGLLDSDYAAARFNENYHPGKQFNGKYSQKTTTQTGGTVSGQNYGNPWKFCEHNAYDPTYTNLDCSFNYGDDQGDNADYTMDGDEERNPSSDTTSFSVADKWGNIVSVTQTINHFFGAKLMPRDCGFFLNNQLSSFTKTSGSASYVEPYKHPTSHIMPTIITLDGEPVATLGSPGSMRLVSAVFETTVNMLVWGMDIQSAIEASRIYSYCVSSTSDNGAGDVTGDSDHKALYVEQADAITEDTVAELTQMGYAVNVYPAKNLFFGGVQGITFENGKMHGGADIRRDGKALGY